MTNSKVKHHYALWTVQILLALLFLFAGVMKFVMPVEEMTRDVALPGAFLHFIGVAEILGALGLILPGLFKIRTGLTVLAAAGLVLIMIGATVLTLFTSNFATALMPLVAGLLTALVAYGRSRLVPQINSEQRRSSASSFDPSAATTKD